MTSTQSDRFSGTTELVRYEAACRALADAKTTDEVKGLHDKAEAMRAYARQAKNRGLEVDAAEIRMRAERRLGEMIKAQKDTVGLAQGKRTDLVPDRNQVDRPTLADAGIDKKLSSRAQKMANVPDVEFECLLGDWRDRVEKENERVTVNLLRASERTERDKGFTNNPTEWPAGQYPIIYADPPWRYDHSPTSSRDIENHYPTMSLDEICALPVSTIALPDCTLLLWSTAPKLAECLDVIRAWDFEYRTCMVWVKDKIGMGYHARNRHEILLIAKRGALPPPSPSNRPDSVVEAPRTAHSAKPSDFYTIIERMYPGLPKVELFSRSPRQGWDAWGFESG